MGMTVMSSRERMAGLKELLAVPPVGEPRCVVGHTDGPLVLQHLHVPSSP
jgi:hypothetical protein